MIASEEEEVLWVFDFVGEQQTDGLERLLAAVHVVAEEQVVWLGRESTVLEQTQEVVVLAVNVTYEPVILLKQFVHVNNS